MQRRAIEVSGVVQGVGFRPFVFALASQMKLNGFVQNRSGAVWIEIEGDESGLNCFTDCLRRQPPPLARIDNLSWNPIPLRDEDQFRILTSESGARAPVFVSPDLAICDECRSDLLDPEDRRYRYPFVNCTQCGPRLTITLRAPYDRGQTTMDPFVMCDQCQAEYKDPNDRRFHAQAITCPKCGPKLSLLDQEGSVVESSDPISDFAVAIGQGRIGAMKGIGGFHLVCDAANDVAVEMLRCRKHRDEKPFAVMMGDVNSVKRSCIVNRAERDLLESTPCPIVLLRKRVDGNAIPLSLAIAPNNAYIGVMLPYTPLHVLLFDVSGHQPLVMTSGNRSDEPIAFEDRDAIARLAGIADIFLVHDREIRVRCDDSLTRVIGGCEAPIRRSRGYAPMPLRLPCPSPKPMLAVGGQLKNVFALASGANAFLSHHIGDLESLQAVEAFRTDVQLYEQLFEITPAVVVHDLHPDYQSTSYAQARANRESIPALGVQHHHAHMASCMAEHQIDGDVIGVIFDGSGYGADGSIWGGEILVGGYESFVRAAHMRPVRLPGGDKATKEPWRVALSYLADAGCDVEEWLARADGGKPGAVEFAIVLQMLERGFNSPWTTSVGRLFDAVAAVASVRMRVSFEGQAAMQLESLGHDVHAAETYPYEVDANVKPGLPIQLDTRMLIRAVYDDHRDGVGAETIGRRFHNTLSSIIVDACCEIAGARGLDRVVLSGGVFLNALLSTQAANALAEKGLQVFQHRVVPPGDGGLCLGQLAIASRRLQ